MSSAWAAVVVAALGLAGTALGVVIRMSTHWTRLESRIAANSDRVAELAQQLREDRQATNARLTWLERQVLWRPRRGRGADDSDAG